MVIENLDVTIKGLFLKRRIESTPNSAFKTRKKEFIKVQ